MKKDKYRLKDIHKHFAWHLKNWFKESEYQEKEDRYINFGEVYTLEIPFKIDLTENEIDFVTWMPKIRNLKDL